MTAVEVQELFVPRAFDERIDIGFVRDSWMRSGAKVTRHMFRKGLYDQECYLKHHRAVVTALIGRSKIVVACHPDYPDQIFGWVAAEPGKERNTLHYIYVKEPYRRRFGVSGTLLAEAGCGRDSAVWCTSWTPWCTKEQSAREQLAAMPMDFNLWKLWEPGQ